MSRTLHAQKVGRAAMRALWGQGRDVVTDRNGRTSFVFFRPFGPADWVEADGSKQWPFRALREAVAASGPGDTIVLGPGTWRGSVVIRHSLTFRLPPEPLSAPVRTEAFFELKGDAAVAFELYGDGVMATPPPPPLRGRQARRRAHKDEQRAPWSKSVCPVSYALNTDTGLCMPIVRRRRGPPVVKKPTTYVQSYQEYRAGVAFAACLFSDKVFQASKRALEDALDSLTRALESAP